LFGCSQFVAAWESVEQILHNLAPVAISVHIKDFAVERTNSLMGFACVGRPIGQGNVAAGSDLNAVGPVKRRPDLIVELWPPRQKTLEETFSLERTGHQKVFSIAELCRRLPKDSGTTQNSNLLELSRHLTSSRFTVMT